MIITLSTYRNFLLLKLCFIFIVTGIWAIDDILPEIPSKFLSDTQLLPEQSKNIKSNISFQDYIPIACFCDWSTCNANVESIQSPIIGLFTREGKIVTSKLSVKVDKGELMFIILIDSKLVLADNTYLERISYWRLISDQQKLIAGTPLDFETRRQISVSALKENSSQFSLENEGKRTVISALEVSTSLSILNTEESDGKAHYYYAASEVNQIVGVYQLFHELVIYPDELLIDYVKNQSTPARCSLFFIMKGSCGSLQLLPSLLQRTSVFRQVAINLTTETNKKSKKQGLLTKKKLLIISILSAAILFALTSTIGFFIKKRCSSPKPPYDEIHMLPQDSDDLDE